MTEAEAPLFLPSRLELARRRRGLTRTRLAGDLGVGVRTLQRWERSEAEPTAAQQDQLGLALGVLPSFFASSELDALPVSAVSFRALSKMTASERDAALAAGRLGVELMEWLETQFRLPEPAVPTFQGWDPELAADSVRSRWDLGERPLPRLLPLLELHGVRVLSLAPDTASVDAFSFYRRGIPYVFLDTSKSAERLRFDAAHELGHLILHCEHGEPQGRAAETEAHRFASALLMPRGSVLTAGLQRATVEQVLHAKSRWHVAAMALAHRLNELELLTEWGYRAMCIELSKRGYRRGEPGATTTHEASQVLGKMLQSLRQRGTTPTDIAARFGWTESDLNGFLFGLTVTAVDGQQTTVSPPGRPDLRVVRGLLTPGGINRQNC